MVLGASPMEEPAHLTAARLRRGLVATVLAASLPLAPAGAQDPAAEATRAVQSLGPPGFLWGRLAAEEESPEGAWTPLGGAAVTLYPYTPTVAADLERIRDSARSSGPDYLAAVDRLQERLKAYEVQLAALTGTPAASATGDGAAAGTGVVRRVTTDPAGLFVFDGLPAGDWLLVAVHTSPYTPRETKPVQPKASGRRSGKRGDAYLPSAPRPVKEAEVWVIRVRVASNERMRLLLTDRAHFMVGPVH
jgi:hypothetical protein